MVNVVKCHSQCTYKLADLGTPLSVGTGTALGEEPGAALNARLTDHADELKLRPAREALHRIPDVFK